MISHEIRDRIRQAIEAEKVTGALASHLRSTMERAAHGPVTNDAVDSAVEMVRDYVEHVPVLLEQTGATSLQLGELESVAPLLQWAAGYFLDPTDYIPDQHGLYGLLDDAYLTLRLLEVLNNIYVHNTGKALIGVSLSGPNRAVRNFIGHDLAAELDGHIIAAVRQRAYDAQMERLARHDYSATPNGAASTWGRTFEDRTAEFFAQNGVTYDIDTHYVDKDGVRLY